jgi:hypothetical protein
MKGNFLESHSSAVDLEYVPVEKAVEDDEKNQHSKVQIKQIPVNRPVR